MPSLGGGLVQLQAVTEPKQRLAITLEPMQFTTGAEEFDFNTGAVKSNRDFQSVQTAWIDANLISQGHNVYIDCGLQRFVFPGGKQAYVALTANTPFNLSVTADAGTTGTLKIVLFNFPVVPGESQTVQTVSGTLTANQGAPTVGAPWTQNIIQVGGAAVTLGQKTAANSIPVVMASDISVPDSTFDAAVTNVAQVAKNAAGTLRALIVGNPNAAIVYLQIFDKAAPVVGTDAPKMVVMIPASQTITVDLSTGAAFANAIAIAATTARANNVAPAAAIEVNVLFD